MRRYLKGQLPGDRIRCIVSMFGLPLRIASPGLTDDEIATLEAFETEMSGLEQSIKNGDKLDEVQKKLLGKRLTDLRRRRKRFKIGLDRVASFDSELSLVKNHDYKLKMWIPESFFFGVPQPEAWDRKVGCSNDLKA